MKHSVLIIEPSEIIYKGLATVINENSSLTVLRQVTSSDNLNNIIIKNNPDIIIVNPTLLNASKCDLNNHIANIQSKIPVIALIYQYVEPDVIKQYDDVIDIREASNKIIRILLKVIENEHNEDSQDLTELSEREKDVLILIAKGQMSKEIADELNISVHTVISHRKNITKKTGIKSIAGLVAYALLNNLIDSSDIE